MAIQAAPVNAAGQPTRPVVWDCNCLEEVCGACTMIGNGRVRQACTALADELEQPIQLEPMSKFPVLRDLSLDRSRMFEKLKEVHAWVQLDGSHDLGPGPLQSAANQEQSLPLIHISEPTRPERISYAVFCLKKKRKRH